jgi:hypothetical protein
MPQEVVASLERLDGSKAIAQTKFFGTRGLQATLQISRCGQIENAITASKVVGRGQGPVGNSMRDVEAPSFVLCGSDRGSRSDQL